MSPKHAKFYQIGNCNPNQGHRSDEGEMEVQNHSSSFLLPVIQSSEALPSFPMRGTKVDFLLRCLGIRSLTEASSPLRQLVHDSLLCLPGKITPVRSSFGTCISPLVCCIFKIRAKNEA